MLADNNDQSSYDSASFNITSSRINYIFNSQTWLVDSFSGNDACQPKPGRTIETVFALSMLSDKISHVEIDLSDDDICSISSDDS